jgi:hypothetical protein
VRRAWLAVGCALASLTAHGQEQEPGVVPAHNRADLKEAPPRPLATGAEQLARALFAAIAADDVSAASTLFFPRAAFLLVKDMADPGRYYDQLYRRFQADLHALHTRLQASAALPEAEFQRFELSARGGFVRVHEEANRLPYWAARHSTLYYKSHGRTQQLELRVLITWDDRWYIIHLSEFH